jgi:outer membrane immunogenic protein
MRNVLLAGVAAVALTGVFSGTSVAAPAAPLMDWSGFYTGGHIGWGRGRFVGTWIDTSSDVLYPFSTRPSGFLGGLHTGHNWQMNTFVYGWEADVSALSGWDQTVRGFATASQGVTTKMSLLASLRGRLGITLDPSVLVYVTGGLGYTRAKGTAFNSTVSNSANFNTFGGVVGAGAEWMQNPNFSWRLEGLWYFFNKSRQIFVVTDQNVSLKLKDAVVIRFGGTLHY